MSKLQKLDYQSPIGMIEIQGTDQAVYSILFSERDQIVNAVHDETPQALQLCHDQLDEYFKGTRTEFTFPYAFKGTEFQKTVWNSLKTVPYAQTWSYKDIAVSIGNEKAIRAVGSANGKNKLSIVIPCHRIIGTNGKLTGYAGGLWRKEWLLKHEQRLRKEGEGFQFAGNENPNKKLAGYKSVNHKYKTTFSI
jgi:methylated-DNA-[protein]-cysteine S-methyltransferase